MESVFSLQSQVNKYVVVILDAESRSVRRRYVFSLSATFLTPEALSGPLDLEQRKKAETHFRGVLTRLARLRPSTEEAASVRTFPTWDVVTYTKGVELGEHWAPADGAERRVREQGKRLVFSNVSLSCSR